MRFLQLPIIKIVTNHLIDYPTPVNISYFWGFGSIAGIFLVVQLITGIFLAMHYTPHVDLAFLSVEHISRDVVNGWFIRYCHSNGASMFFLAVYVHIFRGLYYGSYRGNRAFAWIVGVVIFILMMATAFMGYVLPWGQMSLWAATVITSLFSAIPWIGETIVFWLWGGFSVDNATLNRFFSLHFLLPFVLVGAVILHLAALHLKGSNNPLGLTTVEKVSFYPYFWQKDLFGWVCYFIVFFIFVFFFSNTLGHSDNYVEANALVTPAHIVPEWYFLPLYAVLRSVPDKLGGVCLMFAAILVLLFVPFLNLSPVRCFHFLPFQQFFFWLLLVDWLVLGWIGACAPEPPFLLVGQVATIYYFLYFFLVLPFVGLFEQFFFSFEKVA